MTSRNCWKSFERRIARLFGTERTPLSSSNSRHTHSDTLHDDLYIEVKKVDSPLLLKQFRDEFEKSVELSDEEEKIPMLIHNVKNKKDDKSKVVMELKDVMKVIKDEYKG